MKLISQKPKRLFTFGCSFTNYAWSMWPEIVAYDLDISLYNYGRTGAGNQFIANCITQANATHKFNKDDLVIVCWTNVCREDRWINGSWILPGNIFSQNEYDSKWIKKYADPLGFLVRDLSSINLVDSFLKSMGCQYHFLSMMNITDADQQGHQTFNSFKKLNPHTGQYDDVFEKLLSMYQDTLSKINQSFYQILWNNDINAKIEKELERFNGLFDDGHPWPNESFLYLEKIFDEHTFKQDTKNKVIDVTKNIINEIKNYTQTEKIKHKPTNIWALPENIFDRIIQDYAIKYSPLPYIL